MIFNKPGENQDSLRVNIKTHPGLISSEIVYLCIKIFKTGSSESLLKFLVLLNKIINEKNLITLPKLYVMTKNILAREAL